MLVVDEFGIVVKNSLQRIKHLHRFDEVISFRSIFCCLLRWNPRLRTWHFLLLKLNEKNYDKIVVSWIVRAVLSSGRIFRETNGLLHVIVLYSNLKSHQTPYFFQDPLCGCGSLAVKILPVAEHLNKFFKIDKTTQQA